MNSSIVALSLLAAVALPASEPSRIASVLDSVAEGSPTVEKVVEEEQTQQSKVEEKQKPRWIGKNLSYNEQVVLEYFQDYGITDKVALATLMGNIKQESKFHPNICEGGARIKYEHCHRGGYGLIQWTTSFRYWGLGNHAKLNSCGEEDIKCQLGYLVTEREWKEALWRFKTPDKSVSFYMKGAYRWLGWGIYGNRGYYAQQYVKSLTLSEV